jgi:hypothetical protein
VDSGLLIDELPLWLVFALSHLLIVAAWEAGFRLARHSARREDAREERYAEEIVGAVFGLLAFLLAFTFDMAMDRYGDRQDLAREEAEAIRSAFTSAAYAEEPERSQLRSALRRYAEVRTAPARDQRSFEDAVRRSGDSHAELLRLGETIGRGRSVTDVHALVVSNLDEMMSLHHRRVALGVRSRTPPTVIFTLCLVMAVAMFTVGWSAGEHRTRRYATVGAFAIGFSSVIVLISALDRPKNRLVAENRQVMEELRAWMDAQPSP